MCNLPSTLVKYAGLSAYIAKSAVAETIDNGLRVVLQLSDIIRIGLHMYVCTYTGLIGLVCVTSCVTLSLFDHRQEAALLLRNTPN